MGLWERDFGNVSLCINGNGNSNEGHGGETLSSVVMGDNKEDCFGMLGEGIFSITV